MSPVQSPHFPPQSKVIFFLQVNRMKKERSYMHLVPYPTHIKKIHVISMWILRVKRMCVCAHAMLQSYECVYVFLHTFTYDRTSKSSWKIEINDRLTLVP